MATYIGDKLRLLPDSPDANGQSLPGYELQSYALGEQTLPVHIVDFDGDAYPDVVVGTRSSSVVEIWEFDPAAGRLALQSRITGFPYDVHDVAVADLDNDGDNDLAVGCRFYGLHTVENQGNGLFGAPVSVSGSYSWQVIAEDFDGDGHVDLMNGVDSFASGGFVEFWYGDGAGHFAAGPKPAPATANVLGLGQNTVDLNGDGRPDLLGLQHSGSATESRLGAYLNLGSPASPAWSANEASTVDFSERSYPGKAIPSAADLNGDGLFELVATSVDVVGDLNSSNNITHLMLFNGERRGDDYFWAPVQIDSLKGVGGSAIFSDVDDDGDLDIVLQSSFQGYLSPTGTTAVVYLNDGAQNFERHDIALGYPSGQMNSIATGDLNADGLTDIVIGAITRAGGSLDGFDVLLQQPAGPGGPVTVTISASGSGAPGASPHFTVYADGVVIGSGEIANPAATLGAAAYETFTFSAPAAPQSLEIVFDNDGRAANGTDLNLRIGEVSFGGETYVPGIDGTYVRATGEDLGPQRSLNWNGTLSFEAPPIAEQLVKIVVLIRRGPPAMLAFWGLGTVVMDAHNDGLHHVGQITDRSSCGGRQRSPSPLAAG